MPKPKPSLRTVSPTLSSVKQMAHARSESEAAPPVSSSPTGGTVRVPSCSSISSWVNPSCAGIPDPYTRRGRWKAGEYYSLWTYACRNVVQYLCQQSDHAGLNVFDLCGEWCEKLDLTRKGTAKNLTKRARYSRRCPGRRKCTNQSNIYWPV